MPMSRQLLRHKALVARYHAGKNKPVERRRVQAFMAPITLEFNRMLTGELDVSADSELPITRLSHNDSWEETHKCINGFVEAMERLMPDIDLSPLRWISSDLEKGKLMTEKKVLAGKRTLKHIEDRMIRCTWEQVKEATRTTQIAIKMTQLGLTEAA